MGCFVLGFFVCLFSTQAQLSFLFLCCNSDCVELATLHNCHFQILTFSIMRFQSHKILLFPIFLQFESKMIALCCSVEDGFIQPSFMWAADLFLILSELWQEEKPPIKCVQWRYPVMAVFSFLTSAQNLQHAHFMLIYFGSWTTQEGKNIIPAVQLCLCYEHLTSTANISGSWTLEHV